MLNRIKGILEDILRNNLDEKLRDSVGNLEIGVKLPSISVENINFEFSELGIGRKVEPEDKVIDLFNGDGEKKEFKLKELPLKPSVTVEYPSGYPLNENSYTIDYINGIVKLNKSPEKGKNNVKVSYTKPFEIRGIRVNMVYNVNVWAEDETERDDIVMKVVEVLLKNEEMLNSQEVYLKPIKGYNVKSEQVPKQRFGKILEYLIESELEIPLPSGRIEKVKISKPEKIWFKYNK